MAKVSVIIPAYNHVNYIRQCVDSVLAQTYSSVEILVVDDGSTDGTAEVLQDYASKIRYIRTENGGTQAARNLGIRLSTGEYLALLDSDDAWLPSKLERQIAILDNQPEVGLVYSFAYLIDAGGSLMAAPNCIGRALSPHDLAFNQLLVEDCIPALTAVFRRACFDQLGSFDETLVGAADWDLWLRISTQWAIWCVAEPLALYRHHDTNTTAVLMRTKAAYQERDRVVRKMFAAQLDREIPRDLQAKVEARTHLLGAECEVLAGNILSAGTELAQALVRDPALLDKPAHLTGLLVSWAQTYLDTTTDHRRCRWFFEKLCAEPVRVLPAFKSLKRLGLSTFAMKQVFTQHAAGNKLPLTFIWLGVQADPHWLTNRGVWSIAVESVIGRRAAAFLRRLI